MANQDAQPPPAEANVAMTALPEFFVLTPSIWFQQAEARFNAARPALTSGQKYFHLLGKLPHDMMVNFMDLITQCTIAAATNNGDPYKQIKDAILQFTSKPKWSCYLDLHTLPPQGDIRPSHLMAKLISLLPPNVDPNTDLFYSFFMYRMPHHIREVLAITDHTDARSMAAAADRVWDMRQSAPPPTAAAAAVIPAHCEGSASPRHRARSSRRNPRHHSPSHRRGHTSQPQEIDNGNCWYHNKFQNRSYKCISPCNWKGNGESSR